MVSLYIFYIHHIYTIHQLARRNLHELDKVALLEAKRPILEKQARERQKAGVKIDLGSNLTQGDKGRTVEKLAGEAGISKNTYKNLNTVNQKGSEELKEAVREKKLYASYCQNCFFAFYYYIQLLEALLSKFNRRSKEMSFDNGDLLVCIKYSPDFKIGMLCKVEGILRHSDNQRDENGNFIKTSPGYMISNDSGKKVLFHVPSEYFIKAGF